MIPRVALLVTVDALMHSNLQYILTTTWTGLAVTAACPWKGWNIASASSTPALLYP